MFYQEVVYLNKAVQAIPDTDKDKVTIRIKDTIQLFPKDFKTVKDLI